MINFFEYDLKASIWTLQAVDKVKKSTAFSFIIGIWFRLVDKRLKQILTMSKIKSNAPALLYFSACKNVT
ncbi:hypothetical protein, partial [Massilimicrobiota sp. An105]|uniref:hypothetical protein n=1 Tax=Massilimicrobiota sp. An105 TaxID=1965540 RepID=UPI0019D2A1D8